MPRGAVERRAGADVVRDVGDRDDQAEAAAVRLGEHRVVEVARVLAVDGDQRHVAQVGAAAPSGAARARFGLGQRGFGGNSCGMSWVWMAIRLTERASPMRPSRSMTRAGFRPKRGRAAAARPARSRRPRRRPSSPGGTIHSALARRSVGTMRPPPAAVAAEDAEDAAGRVGQALERAALVAARPDRAQPGQHALAGRQRRAGRAARAPSGSAAAGPRRSQPTGRAIASPSGSVPVTCTTIASGSAAGSGEAAMAGLRRVALGGQVLQQVAQRGALLGAEVEGAGDLALADPAGLFAR